MRTLAASVAMAIVMLGTSFSFAQTPAANDVRPNVLPKNESTTSVGAPVADEQWRFVWKDNRWWYYQPDNSWVYWANNQWNKFVPGQPLVPQAYVTAPALVRTYRSYTPRRPRVSVGFGYGSPYGYYGSPYGFGYPYGGGFGRYGYGYPYGGGLGGYGRSGIGFGIGIY